MLKGLKRGLISSEEATVRYAQFLEVVNKIHSLMASKITNRVDFESVVCDNQLLKENLAEDSKGKPEQFTRDNIIEEFLDFLGFTKINRVGEKELLIFGRRYPDYKLKVNTEFSILVEAEPLNVDLNKEPGGINQVVEWITHKACDTDLGIATDGFKWILIQYSIENRKHRVIMRVDLSPFFREKLGHKNLLSDKEKIERVSDFILYFSKDHVQKTIENEELSRDIYQETISKKFYDEYMKLVFGGPGKSICLVNSITGITNEQDKTLIAQIVIDRLIFLKFIEARGWLNGNKQFLHDMWKTYSQNPTSFYDAYLKVLFFQVLNNPNESTKKGLFKGIKYLNGGLFRKLPAEDSDYSIEDDILEKVIDFLEKYTFGDEQPTMLLEGDYYENNFMSPEILGYIFERTANHTDGAYYTPSNVTSYITEGTLHSLICDIINKKLKEHNHAPIKKIKSMFVNYPFSREELKSLYVEIKNIRILDCACGSGAFFMPAIGLLTYVHMLFIRELEPEQHFDVYKIKKSIIELNIYGAEINVQAVEIAKLRLWLELVSSVKNIEEIDLLPNIEYNIIGGNSLLGFDSISKQSWFSEHNILDIDDWLDMLELHHSDVAERIKELSEEPGISNIIQIKNILVNLYKNEKDPKDADYIRVIIKKVHKQLQAKLNEHYMAVVNPTLKVGMKRPDLHLDKLNTIHWILEFNEVMEKGGFDVILGNPPYVEHAKIDYPLEQFVTNVCGNLYAPFFERAVTLCKENGYFSYIVPISSICTDRMAPLQKLLIRNTSILKVSNFDDRPDKIFKGLEDCRSSIIFGVKGHSDITKVYSTHYFRWYASERDQLFKHMKFVEITPMVKEGIILKIGCQTEIDIMSKISSNKVLKNNLIGKSKDLVVFHNAPRYWIRAMDFMPEFSNDRGSTESSQNKQIFVKEDIHGKDEITSALNSSLFYWFFVINSDCRHLNMREIENFPFDVEKMRTPLRTKLKKLCADLMQDYKKHSKVKDTQYKRTGNVKYREFYPKESKHILDKIDDVLAEHYGFTDEEREYIKNFDLRFRMGEPKKNKSLDNF